MTNASAETSTLPDVPSVREPDLWKQEATAAQAADAVSAVEAMVPADMHQDEVGQLAQMIDRRSYTAAELAYAVEQMMYDEELTKELTSFRNEPTLYPSDFHRFVQEIREKRRRLECVVDRHEMNRLIRDFEELTRSDFGITGYTPKEKPLFRFKSDPDIGDGEVNPKLKENHRPGENRERDENGHGPVHVSETMDTE